MICFFIFLVSLIDALKKCCKFSKYLEERKNVCEKYKDFRKKMYICIVISKNKIKFIASLGHKKYRQEQRLFVGEGPKVVGDLLEVMEPQLIVATPQWLGNTSNHLAADRAAEVITVTDEELRKVSFLQHPQQVLGVFHMPDSPSSVTTQPKGLALALDGVQDPGNLGTIIRIADWFGITHIFCSEDTADVYNPKVVQATMGSIARVRLHTVDLPQWIASLPAGCPVYGTLLEGSSLYGQTLTDSGVIVMGNEGNGISAAVRPLITHKLLIPNYPEGRPTADSLNVAIATAITCAEFRRRTSAKS